MTGLDPHCAVEIARSLLLERSWLLSLKMKIKPLCKQCHRLYLVGKDGVCQSCLKSGTRYNKPRCYCGKFAEKVVFVTVLNPEGIDRVIQLALCRSCLELEMQIEERPARKPVDEIRNEIKIIKVTAVPRADNPPKGRKIA